MIRRKQKISDYELDFGKWYCPTCNCTIDGFKLAELHFRETMHQVIPSSVFNGGYEF